MSMDPWLAQVYQTNGGGAAEDLEKIAQAEMAQQLAAHEGIDLSQLSPEQIQQLGQQVLGGQQQGGGEEITEEHFAQAQQVLANPEQYEPEIVQQAQAIVQHVEQTLAGQGGGQPQHAGQPQGAPTDPAQAGGAATGQGQPGQAEMAKVAEAQAKFEEADFLGRVMAHAFNQESEKIAASKQASAFAPSAPAPAPAARPQVAAPIASAPAPQAAPAPSPAVNAIEKAAQVKAAQILEANGINPQTLQPIAPQAPAAPAPAAPAVNPQAALGELVEKRAHQILAGLGFKVE